ncbi:MAG: hypothetical protein AB1556_07220 [Bacillota bacterium]
MKKVIMILLMVACMLVLIIGCNNNVYEISDTTTQQKDSNVKTVSLPAFKGEVAELTYDQMPLLEVPIEKWLKAKETLSRKHPAIADTIKKLEMADFKRIEAWQGILNGKEFRLDLYALQANFLLIVSQYGDSGVRVDLSPNLPLHAFVFYGENVRLSISAKGVSKSFNIVSGEFIRDSLPDETFDKMFAELTKIAPDKRQFGSKLKISGNDVKVIGENVLVVK